MTTGTWWVLGFVLWAIAVSFVLLVVKGGTGPD